MLVRSFGALPCYAPRDKAGAEPAVDPGAAAPPPAGGDSGADNQGGKPAEPETSRRPR